MPFARGRSRSVLPDEVMQEFDGLVRSGCPEVVLSGIHIGRYGFDLQPRTELTDLIKILIAKRGRTRIRLSSIEPREITGASLNSWATGCADIFMFLSKAATIPSSRR